MTTNNTADKRRRRKQTLGAFQDDLCFFCDQPLVYLEKGRVYCENEHNGPELASLDHYVSRARGGAGTRENTVVAHRQCNSKKGHQPTPEFDEKLRLLNIRRGYVSENNVMQQLQLSAFGGLQTDSMMYLCDLVNAMEGDAGIRLRRYVAKRIGNHHQMLAQFSAIPNMGIRREAVSAVAKKRHKDQQTLLPPLIADLLNNSLQTITKEYFRKAAGSGSAKKAQRTHQSG